VAVAVREFAVVVGAVLGVVVLKEPMSPCQALGLAAIVAGLVIIETE